MNMTWLAAVGAANARTAELAPTNRSSPLYEPESVLVPVHAAGFSPVRAPPPLPLDAAVMRPLASTVRFVFVYDPAETAVVTRVGLGKVPVRSPPAEPLGGSAVGICPKAAASWAPEPFPSPVILFVPMAIEIGRASRRERVYTWRLALAL